MSSSPDRAALAGPVGIVGLGLVGGSAARALVLAGVPVLGTPTSADDRRQAACAGVRVMSDVAALAEALPDGATVLLAVPLGALPAVCEALLPRLAAGVTVLHAAGCRARRAPGSRMAARARVLGTHPLAGSHVGGFAASRAHLFHGAVVSAERAPTRAERRRSSAVAGARRGARGVARRRAHDRTMAWVSHLPQLAAVALAAALDGPPCPRPPAARGCAARRASRRARSACGTTCCAPRPTRRRARSTRFIAEAGALRDALDRRAGRAARAARAPRLHGLWERARRWRAAGEVAHAAGR
jgi:prephenate dehydrogenase